ncbi:tetraspanin-9 isoform X1 [Labeo rohita]|uniref:Tetraspanin-9 isoform X1 n=1 Tax=Labeo rohita TaxID=84645 RepID=A0A498N746_LABRO|nr:tetraspanin-9 isoform X1 [Labeo rohita]
MEKSSSEESAIHRSPSVDSRDSDFAQASTSGRPFGGRGFTAGAFYGSTGPRAQTAAQSTAAGDDKGNNKYKSPKGSKYVVFYLDLSFVFLLEFKKCNMARGCLCCLKYMMFVFNLIFWSDTPTEALTAQQGINPCLSYEKRRLVLLQSSQSCWVNPRMLVLEVAETIIIMPCDYEVV